ncbi:uncharacterized protein BXZ73DRAFT_106655 [Epithele typhae]|uniref:uncharacterized protein n=1 Tax=Epithele typhae TaxID=378194 RepID=UPI002007BCCE|nr:uncharacterized protein BXZ73DRAFT_106655 [Epithele typhae]KAH9914157.1 hypothetical protein BXZ73DRAFT_106655 [Epithele typhae]
MFPTAYPSLIPLAHMRAVSSIVENCLAYHIAISPFRFITVFALKRSVLDHVTMLITVVFKNDMFGADNKESTETGAR